MGDRVIGGGGADVAGLLHCIVHHESDVYGLQHNHRDENVIAHHYSIDLMDAFDRNGGQFSFSLSMQFRCIYNFFSLRSFAISFKLPFKREMQIRSRGREYSSD